MRISRVKIVNHSRIQDLNVEIRRHAVIVGANDVGKSSILRILNLALGTSTAGLYQVLTSSDIRNYDEPLEVNIWWSDFSDENRRLFPSEISIAEDQITESLRLQMVVQARSEEHTSELQSR